MTKLKCIYDARKSFYGKAVVIEKDGVKKLYSYDTLVAKIGKKGKAEVYNLQSQTTLRHIKEFLKQNNIFADTKKQIEKDYFKKI